jgi:hypothetical protein
MIELLEKLALCSGVATVPCILLAQADLLLLNARAEVTGASQLSQKERLVAVIGLPILVPLVSSLLLGGCGYWIGATVWGSLEAPFVGGFVAVLTLFFSPKLTSIAVKSAFANRVESQSTVAPVRAPVQETPLASSGDKTMGIRQLLDLGVITEQEFKLKCAELEPQKRCKQGHYFDPQRYQNCPVCLPPAPANVSTGPKESRPLGWLVRMGGSQRGLDYCIRGLDGGIGRRAGLEVCIQGDETVQPHHATIHYDPTQQTFQLEASLVKSVVRLNGEVVDPAVPEQLNSHDIISLGSTQLMFVPLCGPRFCWQKDSSRVPASGLPEKPSKVGPSDTFEQSKTSSGTNSGLRINLRDIPDNIMPTPADTKVHSVKTEQAQQQQTLGSAPASDDDISQALAVWLANKKKTAVALAALKGNGMGHQQAAEALELAKAKHLKSNRDLGVQRLAGGLACFAIGAALTYSGSRVFVSLLAMGAVFTLVGLVQSITGSDIN